MALSAGSRLGPYEIFGPLGAGGMGEVDRARDTRLERAVKVLPRHLSSPEGRQRFELDVAGNQHATLADGQRFLMVVPIQGFDSELFRVLLNWAGQ